jgi:hypothetical protein
VGHSFRLDEIFLAYGLGRVDGCLIIQGD